MASPVKVGYLVELRNQFTFKTDQRTYVKLRTHIVSDEAKVKVNVVGDMFLKLVGGGSKGKSLIKIVVGPTSAKDDKEGDISQNVQFRASLDKYKIKYTEEPVIRLSRVSSASGIPGSVRVVYALMECNDIDIYSVYGGEALSGNVESYFVQVTPKDIKKALGIYKAHDTAINIDAAGSRLCITTLTVVDQKTNKK
jgi:hypothetical protein